MALILLTYRKSAHLNQDLGCKYNQRMSGPHEKRMGSLYY